MSPHGVQPDSRVQPDPGRVGTVPGCLSQSAPVLHLLPATAKSHVGERIASEAVRQLDELSLIGYPSLDPATRAVYAETIRLVARRVLERG